MPAKEKNRTIILNGQWSNYRFKPQSAKNKLRKVSKFSSIYRGTSDDNKPVLIKVLPEELANDPVIIESFKKETEWFGIHPNILAPYEYIYEHNKHFLILEYIRSINLGNYCRYKKAFKNTRIRMALQCGLQLLDAVECIHNKGKIHADIKPANVLLLTRPGNRPDYKNPVFQLIDFGLTRNKGEVPQSKHKNFQHPFVLVYSPPEQVLGFSELVSYPSDLYNIALLMFEMITKEPVYESNLSVKLMNLQTSFPLPTSKGIPAELLAILHKAASKYHFKKPPNHYSKHDIQQRLIYGIAQRYQTADEFRTALNKFKTNYLSHD